MNTAWDFIRAAAPWIAVGLAVAILAARGVTKKRKGKKQDADYGMEGLSLGMCLGLLIGTMLESYTGIAISLGMLVGLTVGMCIPKRPGDGGKE